MTRRVSLDRLALDKFKADGYHTIRRGFRGSFLAYRSLKHNPTQAGHADGPTLIKRSLGIEVPVINVVLVCCLKQDEKLDGVRSRLHDVLRSVGIEVRILRPSDVTGYQPQADAVGNTPPPKPLRKRFLSLSNVMTPAQEGLREVWRRCLVSGAIPGTVVEGLVYVRSLDFLRWALVDRGVEASVKDMAYLLGRRSTKHGISGYGFHKKQIKLEHTATAYNYWILPDLETCRRLYKQKVSALYEFPRSPKYWHQIVVPKKTGTARAAAFEKQHGPVPGAPDNYGPRWVDENTSRDPMG